MKCRGHQRSGAIYAILVDIYGQYGRFQGPEECISALKIGRDTKKLLKDFDHWKRLVTFRCKEYDLPLNAEIYSPDDHVADSLSTHEVKVLQLMETEGIEPNLIMLNMLINAFGIAGRHLEALSVYHHIKDTVPEIYEEMESAGCTPDRKAREMLQTALLVLQQRHSSSSGTVVIGTASE
ncbi:putative pentatricopeptide repeat-containing protein [Vitis vinifera]|uniref:Putative pentatricopeptide repeat-containing protein n=1 Tax=Vitis vinifera TaxID=29760 RepID=A0A438E238_VITVI|nr:putative pentatricopeptide repeat-containing protein [Vitis vinifera]